MLTPEGASCRDLKAPVLSPPHHLTTSSTHPSTCPTQHHLGTVDSSRDRQGSDMCQDADSTHGSMSVCADAAGSTGPKGDLVCCFWTIFFIFWTIAQPEAKVCSMLGRVSLGKLALIFQCDLCEHEYVCVCFVFSLVPGFWSLFPFAPKMSFRGLSPPLGCILRNFLTMLRSESQH